MNYMQIENHTVALVRSDRGRTSRTGLVFSVGPLAAKGLTPFQRQREKYRKVQ
jgi:hypothetical protein